jgi:N-acetylmuramoyl-L-alanine amidase CwlA
MIDENKFIQYGFPREKSDIQGITLHETGNYEMNAQELHDWLNTECRTNQGVHYICDSKQTIQVMPDDWAVYHTGKGKDWGCRYTIAIEIVSSFSDEDYKKAEDRAISLIYKLQKKYHIPNNMIFFHQDFNSKMHYPNRALDEYGTSKNFVYQRVMEEE